MTNDLDAQLKAIFLKRGYVIDDTDNRENDEQGLVDDLKTFFAQREAEARQDEKEKIWTWVQENNDGLIAKKAYEESNERFDGFVHIMWLAIEQAIKQTKTRDELIGLLYAAMNEKKAELERRKDG